VNRLWSGLMAPADGPVGFERPDEPLSMLRDLEAEPRSDLPARVRRSIERRFLSRDLITFYFTGFAHLVLEWLSLAFGRSGQKRPPEE